MKPRSGLLVVVVLLMASVLVGCGTNGGTTKGEPEIPASIAPVTQAKSLQIPLMSYEMTPQENLVLGQAATKLINQCLVRFGLPGNVPPPDELSPTGTDPSRRYGVVSEQDAQYGYGAKLGSNSDDKEKKKGGVDLTPMQQEVLTGETPSGAHSNLKDKSGKGVPEFGCGGEAWDQVSPHRAEDTDTLVKALKAATDSFQADSRFIELNKQWAQCMEGFGYKFSKRHEAADSTAGGSASREIQVAKHDLQCAHKVNYVAIANAIDTAYQRRYIDEHADAFSALAKHKDEGLKKAHEVLGSGK